mmetsp:Transcript_25152/g.40339  ORF Transcript_25152/g.40339 Transcript_25152/m.40339 type:complete len:354 (+) Transcript_25152:115-1176(+)
MGVAQGNVGLAFGLVTFAGLATTIGSAFVFCSDYTNTKALAAALGMSAGVMLYVSFVEIFSIKAVESFDAVYPNDGSKLACLCFFSGIAITYMLDGVVHMIGEMQKRQTGESAAVCVCHTDPADFLASERSVWSDSEAASHPVLANEVKNIEEGKVVDVVAEKDVVDVVAAPDSHIMHMSRKEGTISNDVLNELEEKQNQEHLKNMGLKTGVAIFLHNFPEGLATFVATLADAKLGVALAVAIAVHNIPEGICVAMPVYYATGSKWKGFWWSFVSGVSEPIGGLFGYLILYGNAMSDSAYGTLFGVVGGMMVYISLKELLPTALKYDPRDQYVTNMMFLGMAVMALSLILFQI